MSNLDLKYRADCIKQSLREAFIEFVSVRKYDNLLSSPLTFAKEDTQQTENPQILWSNLIDISAFMLNYL